MFVENTMNMHGRERGLMLKMQLLNSGYPSFQRNIPLTLIRRAVADLGPQWEKVGERVMRMASDCRDRYRNHIVDRETRVSGMSPRHTRSNISP